MYIYYFIILLPLIFSLKKAPINHLQKRIDHFYWFTFFLILLFIFGLRYQIGGDWNNYLDTFNKFYGQKVDEGEYYTGNFNSFEYVKNLSHAPVFAALIYFSQIFSNSFIFFNFLVSLIFLGSIFKLSSIYKEKWIFLALLIPYLSIIVHTGYVRQSLSIALLALTIAYYYKKNFIVSFVILILSVLTHIATAPFFIIFFKKKFIPIIIFLAVIFLIINFSQIYNLFYYYLGKGIHFESIGAKFRIIIFLPFAILIFYQLKYQKSSKEEKTLFVSVLAIYSLLFIFMLIGKSTFSDRFALSCILFSGMISAKILSSFNSNKNKIFFKLILALYCVLNFTFWMFFSPYADSWIPYKNYLFSG